MISKKQIITTIVIIFAILGVAIFNYSYLRKIDVKVYDENNRILEGDENFILNTGRLILPDNVTYLPEECRNVSGKEGEMTPTSDKQIFYYLKGDLTLHMGGNKITVTSFPLSSYGENLNESNKILLNICESEPILEDELFTVTPNELDREILRLISDCECLDKRFSGCYYSLCSAGDYTIKIKQRFSLW